MTCISKKLLSLLFAFFCANLAMAQSKYKVPDSAVVQKSIKCIGYEVGGGSTKVTFVGTPAAPNASGKANVGAQESGTSIELRVQGLPQPTTLGSEFLTYVLWAVTPDGSTTNLGEIFIDKNGEGEMNTIAQSQTFAMAVTAEPYSLVALPSEVVVLVNDTNKHTKGEIYPENSYKLMKRTEYEKRENPLALTPDLKNVPLEMYEARNAVDIAKSRGAQKYAPEIFSEAIGSLQMAEYLLTSKADKGKIVTAARQTIEFAEDARAFSAERQEAERIQQEKDAAAAAAARSATAALRAQLLQQLNSVLQTTDSPRGLVVNMADVLFDSGKYNLKPDAQIKLAKLAGIIQSHPGLSLAIEGHTDNIGSDEANMKLSQQRADTVRSFLIQQGLAPDMVSAVGLGKAGPVADNSTNEGRQKNRRVEIIVSGDVIGAKIG